MRAIRAGDRGTQSRPPTASAGLRSSASTDVLDALARAIDAGASVWIGYVDNHGTSTERQDAWENSIQDAIRNDTPFQAPG